VDLKFKVPPSKHLGLINFLKIALEHGKPVDFYVEKVTAEKKELSKVKGTFQLEQFSGESIISPPEESKPK
jgi:hypothetical protein